MPYISPEEVKEIRDRIKKEFPSPYKFSITRRHSSTIVVKLMEGPIKLTGGTLNQFRMEWYNNELDKQRIFSRILEIIYSSKECKTREDSDYGSIPDYYVNLSVGSWDKPYIYKGEL